MDLLPIFLDIKNRKCVVVGGGEVALRKATLLSRAGATLHIVSESICEELVALCKVNNGEVSLKSFEPGDLAGARLVIAATDDKSINEAVSRYAHALQIPVNVVDQPDLCSFILPAIVDRSPVIIAISTGGSSPVLTRKLKELNEIMVPGGIDKLAVLLGSFRTRVKQQFPKFSQRIRFWEDALDSNIPELVYSGQLDLAEQALESRLSEEEKDKLGEVYLVGAGRQNK